VVLGVGYHVLQGLEGLGLAAGYQQPTRALGQLLANRGDLLRRLTQAKYDLRQRIAQTGVMVDLGETDVLVGQMAQLGQGVVNGNGARGNRFQQRLQLLVDLRASGLQKE